MHDKLLRRYCSLVQSYLNDIVTNFAVQYHRFCLSTRAYRQRCAKESDGKRGIVI